MSEPSIFTGYVFAGMTAGRPVTLPVCRLKRDPCCGHSTSMPHSSPSESENSSCVHTSFRAKKLPSSAWARQTGVPPASTCFIESVGTSSTDAMRWLANPRLQLRLHELARMLERDSIQHVAEESLDEHPLGGGFGDAARAEVEEMLWIDGPDGRSVRAANVVVVDLEHRDRGRLRLVGKHKVAVGLVGVRPRRVLRDPDQARIHRARDVLQSAFEQQVGARVAHAVVLQRMKVEELIG